MTATESITAEAHAEQFLRSSSPESREIVLVAILKELIELYGGGRGLIPFSTETEQLGYYVPPLAADARFEKYGPKLTEDDIKEFAARVADPYDAIPVKQMIEELKQEEMRLRAAEISPQRA